MQEGVSLYDAVGGMSFFEALVDRFYEGVVADPVLLSIYPEPDDLTDARHKLTLFLAQFWGGPSTYSEERGHPALRMRHARFPIGLDARDRWLTCMRAAVESLDAAADVSAALGEYFDMAAEALRNRDT